MTQFKDKEFSYWRESPEISSRKAERILFEKLNEASQLLEDGESFGRKSAIAALDAVGGFLYVRGANGRMLQPLTNLMEGLKDLERSGSDGRRYVPPIFDPLPRDKLGDLRAQKSRSYPKRRVELFAAACMHALMKSGKQKAIAASEVAKYAKNWPRLDRMAIEGTTISSWRRKFMELGKSDSSRTQFEELANEFLDEKTGKNFLDHVLRNGPPLLGA